MLSPKKLPGVQLFYHFYLLGDCHKYSIYIYTIYINIQYKLTWKNIYSIWFYLHNLCAAKTGYFYAHIYHPVPSCDRCPHQWPPHRWRHGVRNCSRGSRCRSCGPKGVVPGSRDGRNRAWMMWIRWPCEPWKHQKKNMISRNASRNISLNIPFTSHYVYIYMCVYVYPISIINIPSKHHYVFIYIYCIYVYIYCVYIYCIYIYLYIYTIKPPFGLLTHLRPRSALALARPQERWIDVASSTGDKWGNTLCVSNMSYHAGKMILKQYNFISMQWW